ncbi:MAG: hypothetical protein ABEJ31_06525 [Haloarculaceae archaeon]
MFGVESLGGSARAAVMVGAVLGEAGVLYVTYGAAERAFGSAMIDAVAGETEE